jgi:ABC-type dipeptide/oligopeptide/nickel transport system permease component
MILTTLTLIGTFISDILLAWADPRVRVGGGL